MRILIVLMLLIPTVARAQTPPSKTLERAIRLYDREDWYSATIELEKVLDGETGDDVANLQRAAFFQAKAIYQLGFLAASLAWFARIEADAASPYRDPTLKWLLAIARQVPETADAVEVIARYAPDSTAVAQLGDQRDEYAVVAGRAMLFQEDLDTARAILVAVPQASPSWPAAQHALGLVAFRAQDLRAGIRAMVAAAQDPALAPIAVHDLAQWTRLLGDPAAAADALDAIADGTGPGRDAAIYARSRLRVDLPALRGLTDSFDAVAVVAVCTLGEVDVIADGAPRSLRVTGQVAQLRTRYEDDAELYGAVRAAFADDDPTAAVIRLALGRAEPMRWAAELARELEVFADADAAWRSTAIAVDVQSELELQAALAAADAGSWLRVRFEQIDADLARFGDGVTEALPAASSGDGLVVPASLCQEAGLPVHASAPGKVQPPPPVAKKGGCAGCGASAFLVVLLGLRRGARRRLTPHRQLE